MNSKEAINLFVRYLILFLLVLSNISLIYAIFTPATVYPIYYALKLIYSQVFLMGPSELLVNGQSIWIIAACVGGAAYFLLVALNIATPMDRKTRIKSLLLIVSSFFVLNLLRIFIFALAYASGFQYFDFAHKAFWYFGSTILIVAIWFGNVSLLKIKGIPFYTDIKLLIKNVH